MPKGSPSRFEEGGTFDDGLVRHAASTVGIILGASEFPKGGPRLQANEAFSRSASAFLEYLSSRNGMNLSSDSICNLFNDNSHVNEQDLRVGEFLSHHPPDCDLLIYYVGHGGFLSNREYFLALRSTEAHREHLTSFRIVALAQTLKPLALTRKLFLILDCCFAGEAVKEFQSAEVASIAEAKVFESLPEVGTALLIAASKDETAIAPSGNKFTMFSESLLEVLQRGIPEKPPSLSLMDVGTQARLLIERKYGLSAVKPEVHAPRQPRGVISTLPLFPNLAWRKQAFWAHFSETKALLDRAMLVAARVAGGEGWLSVTEKATLDRVRWQAWDAYFELVDHLTKAELHIRELVAWAYYEGSCLSGDRDAVSSWVDPMFTHFFDRPVEAPIRELFSNARCQQAVSFHADSSYETAIGYYDDVIRRFGTARETVIRDNVAFCLFYKGEALEYLGRCQEAIAVYNELIAQFGAATETPNHYADFARPRLNKLLANS